MRTMKNEPLLTRRQMTEGLLTSLGGLLFLRSVAACTGGGDSDTTSGGSSGSTSSGATTSSSSSSSGSTSSSTGGTTTGSADAWATGGTKSMTAKASYPDPFAVAATSCVLLTSVTEGPCTEAADQVREDISEGYSGLPMRLAFRVVDSHCQPVVNATVKVWHTQLTGSYSGDTPNPGMCLKDQADASKHYFRGMQTTDADGKVFFDSCFPGWYRGRTPHIHYTVTANGKSFTSQVVFDQTLVQEIFASHEEYKVFGQPDTTNASDNVVGRANTQTFVVDAARMSDGAMLASKLLVVFA